MTHRLRPPLSRSRTAAVAAALAGALLLSAPARGALVEELRRHVATLASEELEGRLTGTGGARAAADYLAAELAALGAVPLPGQEGFEQPFEFTAGTSDAGSRIVLSGGEVEREWTGTDQVQALSFSDNGEVRGPVVFAGYGIVLPEGRDFAYDSYAGLDVQDKIVVALRYHPEDVEQEARAELARYSGLRFKGLQAREAGAKALILITGPRSPNAGETIPMTFDTAISGSGLVAASVGAEVAEALFSHVPDKTLEQAQSALDDGNPHVTGFDIPGVEITLEAKVAREKRVGRNLLALLPGSGTRGLARPAVVLGAHFDHLGRGGGGNSLAKKEEAGGIHYGADDNASGVAAVLETARALAAPERRRDLVVALWSGEELGLLGSSAFVREAVVPTDRIAAYVNLDMVGRMQENKLSIQAMGSSSVWPALVERVNVPVGFDVRAQDDPYLPTDSTSFNQAGVPTLNLFTGGHEDYHRPSDVAERINYDDLARVTRFATLLVGRLLEADEPPDFVRVEPRVEQGGGRDTLRAFTGTVPDYTTEVEGLRLSGVIGGGPADEAGLREGDVIVEFAGQKITNIYDYTYALDAVKIGVPVQVVVLREGERLEVTITPRARD